MAKKDPNVIEPGIMLGVICLALVVIFSVGITRWHKNSATSAAFTQPISLPTSLSGGLTPYKPTDSSQQQQLQQQLSSFTTTATTATGSPAAFQVYTDSTQKTEVIVQAARVASGVPLVALPGQFSKIGDDVCTTDSGTSGVVCQRTDDHLTVQVTAQDAATAAKYTDEVYGDVDHNRVF